MMKNAKYPEKSDHLVKIRMMNLFTIEADGIVHEELMAKSRKGISLIQYLILERGKPVASQRLIRELWHDHRSENPESALKTMVSRVRATLNSISPELGNCIVSGQGNYRWQSHPHVWVDVLEIIDLLNTLRNDTHSRNSVIKKTETLMDLYKGDLYLTGDILNGQAMFNWLHNEYLSAVCRYIELLKTNEEYTKICDVCRRAILIDDLDDQIHLELMQAMANLNRSDEAAAEYRKLTKRSRDFYDAEPGEEIQAYYETLAKAGKTIRFNLDIIRNELIEKEGGTRGPFFCEYEAFKEVYNIYMRNLERLGSTMFLGIIMLGEAGNQTNVIRRESCMAGLQEILKTNMRKGDIITRFSENTYALLLPTVNYSSGNIVMERIENLYYQEYSSHAINMHVRISPLGTTNP